MKPEKITTEQVKTLLASGQFVYPMPRKGMVRVNGSKLFRADKAAIEAARKHLNSHP